jgi:hypothetical protein
VEAGGKLECEVANRLRVGLSHPSIEKVRKTILKLETGGIVTVGRNGSVMRSMALVPKQEVPMGDIKEEEAVKETKVTQAEADSTDDAVLEQQPVEPPADEAQDAWRSQLSLALLALQTHADEDGLLEGASAKIIAEDLQILYTRATRLNSVLAKLGLREEVSGSRRNIVHRIDMNTKEVTSQMLETLAAKQQATVVEAEPVFVEPVLPVQPEPSSLSVEEQLAEIIVGLEEKIKGLQGDLGRANEGLVKEMERYDNAANESARVIGGLTEDLQEANRTIGELRSQIAALQAPPSERVKSLLDKYRPAPSGS